MPRIKEEREIIWQGSSDTSSSVDIMTSLWVEREDQGNFNTQGNHRVLNKEVGYPQRRKWRGWWRSPEDTQMKEQCMGFINNHPKWHTFWAGEALQRECRRNMDVTHWKIWNVWRKTREY